jgi:hypothetical protein
MERFLLTHPVFELWVWRGWLLAGRQRRAITMEFLRQGAGGPYRELIIDAMEADEAHFNSFGYLARRTVHPAKRHNWRQRMHERYLANGFNGVPPGFNDVTPGFFVRTLKFCSDCFAWLQVLKTQQMPCE